MSRGGSVGDTLSARFHRHAFFNVTFENETHLPTALELQNHIQAECERQVEEGENGARTGDLSDASESIDDAAGSRAESTGGAGESASEWEKENVRERVNDNVIDGSDTRATPEELAPEWKRRTPTSLSPVSSVKATPVTVEKKEGGGGKKGGKTGPKSRGKIKLKAGGKIKCKQQVLFDYKGFWVPPDNLHSACNGRVRAKSAITDNESGVDSVGSDDSDDNASGGRKIGKQHSDGRNEQDTNLLDGNVRRTDAKTRKETRANETKGKNDRKRKRKESENLFAAIAAAIFIATVTGIALGFLLFHPVTVTSFLLPDYLEQQEGPVSYNTATQELSGAFNLSVPLIGGGVLPGQILPLSVYLDLYTPKNDEDGNGDQNGGEGEEQGENEIGEPVVDAFSVPLYLGVGNAEAQEEKTITGAARFLNLPLSLGYGMTHQRFRFAGGVRVILKKQEDIEEMDAVYCPRGILPLQTRLSGIEYYTAAGFSGRWNFVVHPFYLELACF